MQAQGWFDQITWNVDASYSSDFTAMHEEFHSKLNDVTLFGLVMDVAYVQARRGQTPDTVLRGLSGMCRRTHESFATYLAWNMFRHRFTKPHEILPSLEYQNYFDQANVVAARFHNPLLGALAVSAVGRLAMNGPLPDGLLEDGVITLKASQFRAKDTPDRRWDAIVSVLDRTFWQDTLAAAKAFFSPSPLWELFYEDDGTNAIMDGMFGIGRVIDGVWHKGERRFSEKMDSDVANFISDKIAEKMAKSGIPVELLQKRMEIESQVRAQVPGLSSRFYDDPDNFKEFSQRRLMGREQISLSPNRHPDVVEYLSTAEHGLGKMAAFLKDDGIPACMCPRAQFANATGYTEPLDLPEAMDFVVYCYKRRRDENGQIYDWIMVLDDLEGFQKFTAQWYFRFILYGQLLLRPESDPFWTWQDELHGHHMSVLLDAYPGDILDAANVQWACLGFTDASIRDVEGCRMAMFHPVGADPLPDLGFFRPCTVTSTAQICATITPEPLDVRFDKGIQAMPEGTSVEDFQLPAALTQCATDYLTHAVLFQPLLPEDHPND